MSVAPRDSYPETVDAVAKVIRQHLEFNRFEAREDGSAVIDPAGLELTLSESLAYITRATTHALNATLRVWDKYEPNATTAGMVEQANAMAEAIRAHLAAPQPASDAQGAVSCGVTDQDKIETLQKLVAEYKERAIEVVRAEIASGAQGAVAPWLWACTGCGSQMTMDQIKGEHPSALCCCPERRMAPLPSTQRGGL